MEIQRRYKSVYKTAWKKRSLEWNCHWIVYETGLQHSLAIADLPLRKLWKRRRLMMSSNSQSNQRHLRRKCHWMTLTRMMYKGPLFFRLRQKKVSRLPLNKDKRTHPGCHAVYNSKALVRLHWGKLLGKWHREGWDALTCGNKSDFRWWWWLRDRHSKRERGWNMKIHSTVMKLLNKYKQNKKQKKQQQNIQLQIKTHEKFIL